MLHAGPANLLGEAARAPGYVRHTTRKAVTNYVFRYLKEARERETPLDELADMSKIASSCNEYLQYLFQLLTLAAAANLRLVCCGLWATSHKEKTRDFVELVELYTCGRRMKNDVPGPLQDEPGKPVLIVMHISEI